ncbi:MAG: response regulator [Anaerolineales bacterium]|nr:response regulator [Anaerolineales bacterium]
MPDARLLIIDDEAGIVRLCQRLLERAGYEVTSSTDPQKGVEILRAEKFDLLLVDIRMPGLGGFEVIEKARMHQPDIAVVIMTGFGTLETAIRALRQGADGLILKPFEEGEELVSTVREALLERQHKQEMARLRAIRPLLDMTESLFSETRYDALLDLILKAITGHMRCSHAGIYRRTENNPKLRLIASAGNPLSEEVGEPESGLVARADHWRVPIWVNRDGPGPADLQAILEAQDLRSVICMPVQRNETHLVFVAGRGKGEDVFQQADLDMFGILARQADIALENARLYGELREYIRAVEDSQRALIQAEKMAAVGRLTTSIAHEVNNPLQSMRNCLHLVGRVELSEGERETYLDLAKDELERLMFTVQRMLEFYRPGALEKKPENVNELITKILALLRRQLTTQNIVVTEAFEANLPSTVVVSNQIQQVIWNIILNAMDVMPDGGELTISTYCNHNKDYIEVTIEDTGPGVPPEDRERIFEPFFSKKREGTGLGLSVSYGILTAHGGSLELAPPKKGSGACFLVRLPIQEAS